MFIICLHKQTIVKFLKILLLSFLATWIYSLSVHYSIFHITRMLAVVIFLAVASFVPLAIFELTVVDFTLFC